MATLKNTFTCRDAKLWKILYTSLVRPHLEYAAPVWNPTANHKGNVKAIELVQQRATKVGQSKVEYWKRLRILGLSTHADRRARGDCIEMYKLINNPDSPEVVIPFGQSFISTRRNSKALVLNKNTARQINDYATAVRCRLAFLTNRVNTLWNSLPSSVVESPNLNSFKNNFDRHVAQLPH